MQRRQPYRILFLKSVMEISGSMEFSKRILIHSCSHSLTLDGGMATRTRRITSQTRRMASRTRRMASRTRRMASRMRRITSLLRRMASRTRRMASRTRRITSLPRRMASRTRWITSLTRRMASRTRRITSWTRRMTYDGQYLQEPHNGSVQPSILHSLIIELSPRWLYDSCSASVFYTNLRPYILL
eukprot:XP_011674377.1 PREDICTED: uncharacterized protein LOC105443180 [Strongylocentrotus purpuratus]